MRIWKLTPTDLSDPRWKLWSPEPIIVRAESEVEARHLAGVKTTKALPPKFGEEIIMNANPRGGHKKIEDPAPKPTLCEDVTEQTKEYSVDGSAEVLNRCKK